MSDFCHCILLKKLDFKSKPYIAVRMRPLVQHPWTPSGILPVPADPEEAWADFVEWCRDGPYHSAEPLLRKETYLRLFTEHKPYHQWELRQPAEPAESSRENTPVDFS